MLKLADKPNQRPRHRFCKDLKFLLDDRIKEKHKIILMGDFNEELGSSVRGITKVVANCNLVDVYAAKLEDAVPTYSRGTKRLDYILMTPTVASHVTRCGADPFNHRFFSDHRGIYLDLELEGLFDRNLPPLARPTYGDIRSGNSLLI
jgi:endonuclease/exonuclease/phosphatase family metal-dependent hydrolase